MIKKVIFTLLISLSILIVGCGNKQILKPTSQKPNETITTKNSSANSNKLNNANKVNYKLTNVIYKIKNITINYPKIIGLSDSNKQNKMNILIKNDALFLVNASDYPIDDVSLNISYTIKLSNSNLLSIIYTGESYVKGGLHPNNEFYTTNINVENGTKLKLSDFVTINKSLANSFKNGKYIVPVTSQNNKKLQSAVISYIKSIDSTTLINEFNQRDINLPGCSYLTKDSIGISTSLPHAIGDHAEFEINLQNINTKNELLVELE